MKILAAIPILGLFSFGAVPAHAGTDCGTYPPEARDQISTGYSDCWLHDIGERPLWHGIKDRKIRQQIRFTFTEGHFRYTRFLTFTEYADGTGSIRGARIERDPDTGELALSERRRRRVTAENVARLNELAAASGTWQYPVGSWDGDGLFMHCQTLDMERVDAAGYSLATVNISCNHPTKLMPLIQHLTALAKAPYVDGELY